MNKRQKEVFQHQLDAEEAILKELEKQYRAALKDIREKIQLFESDIYLIEAAIRQTDMDDAARAAALSNRQSKIYQKQYQEALEKQLESILDKLHSDEYGTLQKYLQDSYEDGFLGTMYDLHGQGIPMIMPIDQAAAVKAIMTDSKISGGLYESLGVDVSGLKKAIRQEITRGIASGMGIHDIARNIANVSKAPMSRAKNIARTECHRIQQASTFDAQEKAKGKGADVVKQWDSTLDGATRPVHMRLDGQIREVDEPFEAGGRKAMYPGDFGDPAEDCNCRCVSLTRARWALDEEELQTLKDRAEYFGLDKTEDFNDFKKKYLKAAEEEAKIDSKTVPMTAEEQAKYLKKFFRDKNQTRTNQPVTIGGLDVTVIKDTHGFSDGHGGSKKVVDAIIYETKDGTRFIFPKTYNKKQQTMTPEQAIAAWQRVPQSIRKQAQKTIEFVDYYNPADSYWKKVYKNFPHSYATGGNKITFYRYEHTHDDDYVVRTYCHEAGHFIDTNLATNSGRFSEESLWTKAMSDDIIVSGKKSCTEYGENANAEDFAESIAEYVKDKDAFTKDFPNRAAILANIVK